MTYKHNPWIELSRGGRFHFDDMQRSRFTIDEIAYALSNISRFTGHTNYSVAEHSVLTSYLVPRGYQFEALMHDAHEAFVGDISSPLKQFLPDYQALEKHVAAYVRSHFGLPPKTSKPIANADLQMLAREKKELFPHAKDDWSSIKGIAPAPVRLQALAPNLALRLFMDRFRDITSGVEWSDA